jgi:hypothetical protein
MKLRFVERQILELDKMVKNDPDWLRALNRMNFNKLNSYRNELQHLTHHVIFTQDYTNDAIISSIWNRLVVINSEIFRIYDECGYTKIMNRYGPEYLDSIYFAKSHEFRKIEEELLSEINIPKKIWDEFWNEVDEKKKLFMKQMLDRKDFSLYNTLDIQKAIKLGPGSLGPMSPFNKGKIVFASIGGILSVVNAFLAPASAGISLSSVIAGAVLNIIDASRR